MNKITSIKDAQVLVKISGSIKLNYSLNNDIRK